MLRIALAPCSPFTVTRELMIESAALARSRGVRLHTHLCETLDEEAFCLERFGMRPVEYVGELGWMGDDVWFAHCVHLSDDEVARFGAAGVGVAHCPTSNARLGSGIAKVQGLREAGVAVGLGVDGAASNEAGTLQLEVHASLMAARFAGGPTAMTVREALAHGTIHGARCLGRDGRARFAGGRQAGRHRAVAGRRPRRRGHRRPGRGAGARARRAASSTCWSAGGWSCATASCAPPTSRP